MYFELSVDDKSELEQRHRKERDGRVRDRIKAVLLKSEGWKNEAIAQALRIHVETVADHLAQWSQEQKLKPENGGSNSKLTLTQTRALEQHLDTTLYTRVIDICAYVFKATGIHYTVSGMTKWLQEHGFSYKQPKVVPAKADIQKQEEFIEKYLQLQEKTPADEPIVFMDAVHPTMATKISHGWIKKGQDKPIAQTASRTRVNIIGALELASMNIVSHFADSVNAETIVTFLDALKAAYPNAPKLHVILDQSGYHRSEHVRKAALERNMELHYLPPYSPNLNPIERLWKIMNEQVRNNVFFESATSFRYAIADFFRKKIPLIKHILINRINDNFQLIQTVSSG
jgi:transposase